MKKIKFINTLCQYIKDKMHQFNQRMTANHDRRLSMDREAYFKEMTEEAEHLFNFTTYQGRHLGTFNGVVITLITDEDTLLYRISELRSIYVELKMQEYDNGKN